MGKLKPGATYIYERVGGTIYARESGSLDREAIGWDYDPGTQKDSAMIMQENQLWRSIREEAKSNQSLREALDRVILLYHLSKKDGQE
jgi:hypothetical protein